MCNVCNQSVSAGNNCPCCSVDPITCECSNCSGTGKLYFDVETGRELNFAEYNLMLSSDPTSVNFETCTECEGEGRVDASDYFDDEFGFEDIN